MKFVDIMENEYWDPQRLEMGEKFNYVESDRRKINKSCKT